MFEPLASDPRAQLRAIMVYLTERTTSEGYLGCPFINYCAEFRDPGGPGRRVAQATKTALRQRFVIIASALKVEEPRFLADSLLLLLEGAYALSQTLGVGEDSPAYSLVQAAEALVASQEIGS